MKLLILLHHRFELWNAPAWFAQRLQKDFPHMEIVHLSTYDKAEEELRDAEIAITWSLRPEQFALARKLRWIHSPAAAVHQLMFPELLHSDVVITNSREVHAPVVAEHAIAFIFALAKKIPQSVRFQQERIWGKELVWSEPPRPREVAGATLGLIGLGSIGKELGKRAVALDMKVIAVRKHPEKGNADFIERVFPVSEMNEVIALADYLVLAAPRTPETEKFITAERLAKMKPESYFINVSRGALVDEAALEDALRRHRIAGAALDVFSEEPLPANSPLWDLENLLMTPHSAAITENLWERHYAVISNNLCRYLTGHPLLAVVDKQSGY